MTRSRAAHLSVAMGIMTWLLSFMGRLWAQGKLFLVEGRSFQPALLSSLRLLRRPCDLLAQLRHGRLLRLQLLCGICTAQCQATPQLHGAGAALAPPVQVGSAAAECCLHWGARLCRQHGAWRAASSVRAGGSARNQPGALG